MIAALVGPTASGKSDIAVDLALEAGAEILSCDSLLVYKGMNVGTAKPTTAEMRGVVHHGIDLIDVNRSFTAADFVRYARPIIDELIKKKKPLLIVGGTGFYLKALVCGVWDAPPTQPEIRERLEKSVAHLPKDEAAKALHAELAKKDPAYSEKIKTNDVYRVIRALEIIEVEGKPVSEMLSSRTLQNALPYPVKIFGIKRSKPELERRILARTNAMFSNGMVKEAEGLLKTFPERPRALNCIGYDEVIAFLDGKMTMAECRERILISTRQLARKQMTFFKTFPTGIDWLELPAMEDELKRKIRECLKS